MHVRPEDWQRGFGPAAVSDACPLLVDGPFTVGSLSHIRQAIVGQATSWRLGEVIMEAVQAVCSELAANIIVHAEGDGRLILTHRSDAVFCQAVDRGPGMLLPFMAGWHPPAVGDPAAARGLWLVRTLSTHMQIDSSVMGTTVTAVLAWKRA